MSCMGAGVPQDLKVGLQHGSQGGSIRQRGQPFCIDDAVLVKIDPNKPSTSGCYL